MEGEDTDWEQVEIQDQSSSHSNTERHTSLWTMSCEQDEIETTPMGHPPIHESESDPIESHADYRVGLGRRIAKFTVYGGLIGLATGLFIISLADWGFILHNEQAPYTCHSASCPSLRSRLLLPDFSVRGIKAYLDLFDSMIKSNVNNTHSNTTNNASSTEHTANHRHLAEERPRNQGPSLVIAGKMAVEDGPCNIAQYDLKADQWSLKERIQLSLYNSYSGGEVYSLLANHTMHQSSLDQDEFGIFDTSRSRTSRPRSSPQHSGSGELLVVGAFDTTYRNSQVTYCSVGMWDGLQLSKVGEGLCNSALSKGMKITTAALAGPQDVYVAGSFQTQVWNGDRHEFVKIFNIAHFNAADQVWLPLDVGQITCSWCTVTVLALAWDSTRRQLHVAGKFNSIDGRNVPAGLAIYDYDSGHLVAHPGGGLSMLNISQDGVGTALQLDEESGVLYVMGSFERLTATYEVCLGLAAYEIQANRWTCLADAAHTVYPSGGGNMLLTPFGLMVAGKTTSTTTWPDSDRPYTIALLKATLKTKKKVSSDDDNVDDDLVVHEQKYHDFNWSWLPGFDGHDEPLHALANGFGMYDGTVFIAGDNLVAKWSMQNKYSDDSSRLLSSTGYSQPRPVPTTNVLSNGHVRGAIMAISQMMPESDDKSSSSSSGGSVNITIIVYCVSVGCVIGVIGAILCNRNVSSKLFPMGQQGDSTGFTLDTLTHDAIENSSIMDAYKRAMEARYVQHPHLLTIINPKEILVQRIIGEGTFGRVWSAKWRSASVAVKEFVFAQAAVAGRSKMQQEIVEEIIGEAGMMAILRHPNVLQLFGCSLTAQAIWIVSELCSLGSLRQLLDDNDRTLSLSVRLGLALQVAEGMTYLHNQDPPIIHRDLKSHNIFVHETFTDSEDHSVSSSKNKKGKDTKDHFEKISAQSTMLAKIGDWGSARATLSGSRTMTHGVGTACWLAPEVIKHARSSKYSDVYSYGIVLWELATREEVYRGLETTQIIAKVANENLRPPVPQDCPWKDLMVQCWAENPKDRLEFTEIVLKLSELSESFQNGSRQDK
eukprot:CAMPEP_0172455292 /NCGR_PEP_ID=MMETSP1065-20121228/11993_1 /TAXON_ID=265537 /ORGANISM="Amphiprora paludosa, Strain CCMP125" /LENGTH=1049 /DNA_ID=CAMNT_0013207753 /DNA_START=294 /DNA_END=3443 /DNA_ORIENTATION=-